MKRKAKHFVSLKDDREYQSIVEAEYRAYQSILKALQWLTEIDRSRKTPYLIEKRFPRGKKAAQQIESSREFIDKTRKWSGQEEIAALIAYQLYVKAQAYLDKEDQKNAHKFYDLAMKALKLCRDTLKEFNLEEFEKRLKRLEAQSVA